MSWIKDCKDSLIELGQAAGVLSTAEERATDIQVHIEENNKKIVDLRKEQKVTWAKAAAEVKEMGVTQEDFDLLDAINPLGNTVLPAMKPKETAKNPRAESKFENVRTDPKTTDVEVKEGEIPAND